jgi:surfeit locus 1 family protein
VWQIKRLAWKQALIAQVDRRIHAAAVPAPGRSAWAGLTRDGDAYRRVRVGGAFLPVPPALVKAVTIHGEGFWVMAPMRTDAGYTLLVNRGFVPAQARHAAESSPPAGTVAVTGLSRRPEPGGGFLRSNDPAAGRWYSRDVAAIAHARRLAGPVAPYFIDAEAEPGRNALPIGGLTVVSFPNNHMVYALTWFALAAMTAGAYVLLMREDRKLRRHQGPA